MIAEPLAQFTLRLPATGAYLFNAEDAEDAEERRGTQET
jgi:hypothetical protein